ncbi:MAG: transporter [Oscillospiraceae bacterium]|nr:transporter [Oscillospiraceae bacterium]
MENMEKSKKGMNIIEKIAKLLEIGIAIILIVVIVIKIFEISINLLDIEFVILNMGFKEILSIILGFVVGVEFVKMMCKHTSESVMDLLLFAIARQIVAEHASMLDTLIGVVTISGLFAVKKYLIKTNRGEGHKNEEKTPSGNP